MWGEFGWLGIVRKHFLSKVERKAESDGARRERRILREEQGQQDDEFNCEYKWECSLTDWSLWHRVNEVANSREEIKSYVTSYIDNDCLLKVYNDTLFQEHSLYLLYVDVCKYLYMDIFNWSILRRAQWSLLWPGQGQCRRNRVGLADQAWCSSEGNKSRGASVSVSSGSNPFPCQTVSCF